MDNTFDVVVIGGGQSGLAMGYYLRRTGLSYVILDNQKQPGGAWPHTWRSLRLFSPAQWSALPGMLLTGGGSEYPARNAVVEYLANYESKYNLQVRRPVSVTDVSKEGEVFKIETAQGTYFAKTVVNATGSFSNPFIPKIEGQDLFKGRVLHSAQYRSPVEFANERVAVVGEGNSGAQILAEVSLTTETLWITQKEPRFLPDHIDGRYLFDAATQMYEAQKAGVSYKAPSLGDIVMVDSVKDAKIRNVLTSRRPFERFTENSIVWSDGQEEKIDVVIFCTGFNPALKHLSSFHIGADDKRPATEGTRSKTIEGLWFVGYGNWTGFASATLIGVGRSAKTTVEEIVQYISGIGKDKSYESTSKYSLD
ncbi:ArsO family NAD(P)H-dependent flavin-containing monooxygenase [Chryseolinea soli]|uniref:NAD(P)/FAD-dependent oxidoreductase n=1 Tax=Chryseolinea soli TaxID=2321403 RepID=A0A385SSW5_9BACT|nr:ArsO family NAD(P)H-dependent flavin-containing monooxygenase [Chryseolinea soli]AYB33972.1 NAD(P)/FAD-dependent oxidoreductase [Chryseolinea soli]